LPNVFQNGSNSTKEATPSEEPEPEPFSEEPEPCQTGPNLCRPLLRGRRRRASL
jgi:hypothetical protein